MQFETAQSRQPHVEHQAADHIRELAAQQLGANVAELKVADGIVRSGDRDVWGRAVMRM